jgi:PAS domain S-box-containing protein
VTFEHITSAFGADICFNYRLDPARQCLRLVFARGIPPDKLEAARSLQLGQAFCGTAVGGFKALVADKQRIASDPKGAFLRGLGATSYACHPLIAADGRVLGTFSVASTTRERFTDDEVVWLGTITNFLAQAWERFEAEQGLRASEERLRLSHEAAGLGHWDFDFATSTMIWPERTRKLIGVGPAEPASVAVLLSRVHPEDRQRLEEHIARSARPGSPHGRHVEFRVMMQNGDVRWLENQSQVQANAAGMPVRAFGVVRDITARKNTEQAQARLAAIVTSSADAIIGKTLDGIVTSWNEAAEHMFGYSAGEMIGQSIRRLIPADRQAEEDLILARLARSESIVHFETTRLAKDGRTFDASVTISPVHDAEGRIIGAAKIIRDITERKKMEWRLHLLMREASHRAKNILSLVQAIVRQTTAREPEDFVGRLTERIHALAANQDLLVRNEWQGADVDDLVRAQLAHFADLVGSRIAMHGPKMHLNAAAAQAIGLALHELATNAGKYGALSTDRGRVDVGWGTDGDTLTMNWTERDGPRVSPPERRGFGTIVMEAMAERSVDGKVDLHYAPPGVTWRLTCPTANALERRENGEVELTGASA